MTAPTWVLATDAALLTTCVALARGAGGPVTVVAAGPRALADAAAATGPDRVLWAEPEADRPAESLAPAVAAAAAEAGVRVLVSTVAPAARALLGAAATAVSASVVPGAVALSVDGDALVVERSALDGAVLETLATSGALALVAHGDELPAPDGAPAPVEALAAGPVADLRVVSRTPVGGASGVRDAERVVSIGRGVRAKADLELIGTLTGALDAELACSMPIADDLGWVPKERYIGRSGQHIAPRLYLAVGIAGMPQHMEGVRDAKVVAAVNNDPAAPIFRTADYGVVGDLYEVVPALVEALRE